MDRRWKAFLLAAGCLGAVWLLAWAGYMLARGTRLTAEQVGTYLRSVDLSQLRGREREAALHRLARMLNSLSLEERRTARLDREWSRWFRQMTEPEKGELVEATLPTGFRQMLGAFEQLPAEKRRRSIDDALKRLKEAQAQLAESGGVVAATDGATNTPPVISDELRQKATTLGLKAFYAESSAQTKAELAPLLEELQRIMESGAILRGR